MMHVVKRDGRSESGPNQVTLASPLTIPIAHFSPFNTFREVAG